MLKTRKHKKMSKISYIAIIVIVPILIVIGLLSIYGRNVDNFYVSISSEGQDGLSLSKFNDFSSPTTFLKFSGMEDMRDTTWSRIRIPEIMQLEGDNSDYAGRHYLAYTFFVRNSAERSFTYDYAIKIVSETKGVSAAMRVMVAINDEERYYAKATSVDTEDSLAGSTERTPEELEGKLINFLSPTTICEYRDLEILSDSITKFTIVIWLEGEDNECVDKIKGGTIFMSMEFDVHEDEHAEPEE